MQTRVRWNLESVEADTIPSMVGGDSFTVDKGFYYFRTTIEVTEAPESDYLLLDMGHSCDSLWSYVYFNGFMVGEICARYCAMRFCVPARLVCIGTNELLIKRQPPIQKARDAEKEGWEKRLREELHPESTILLVPFEPAGAVTDVSGDSREAALATSSGSVFRVRFVRDADAVRLSLSRPTASTQSLADSVSLAAEPSYETMTVDRREGAVEVQSPVGSVVVEDDGWFAVRRPDGTQGAGRARFEQANDTMILRWSLGEKEHIFGLGENAEEGMDKRGKREYIWVLHSFHRCDKPVPFLVSTAGYGLNLHSSQRAMFDLDTGGTGEAFCFCDTAHLEVFFFLHKEFPALVRDFTHLTGRSPMPPRWAFGYWQSTTRPIGQKDLEETARGFDERGIPVDVFAIDPSWQKRGFQSWEWDEELFPEPEKLHAMLKQRNLHLSLWSCPFVNPESPLYREAADRGYLMKDEDGNTGKVDWWIGRDAGLMDFTSDEAVRWWGERLRKHVEAGVSVLKIDGGDANEVPPELMSGEGLSTRELHNLYPVLFARAVHEESLKAAGNRRVLTWIRTGFTGVQRYPCCWGGDQFADFHGGRVLIKAGQQCGLAGISFWSHDLGGFSGNPTDEYYIRSFQWGLFSPLARAHGRNPHPWAKDERVVKIVAQYIRLRYRLIPTLYSYAWFSHRTGEPMMRAMVLDHQDDTNVYEADYQYMLGRDLLVAPIYEETGDVDTPASRSVYLPKGLWYDYWTDEKFAGAQDLPVIAPIEELPLFVRAGAILVYGPESTRASTLPDKLRIDVYAGGDGMLTYYEDDGYSLGYIKGEHAETPITVREIGNTMKVTVEKTRGRHAKLSECTSFELVIHGRSAGVEAKMRGGKEGDLKRLHSEQLPRFSFSKTPAQKVEIEIMGA